METSDLDQRRADRRVQTVCLLIITFIASAVALYLLKPVLVPFVLALFFTYCLKPLIDVQIKYLRAPRLLAVIGASVFGLAVLALAGFIVAAAIAKMSDNFDDYQRQFRRSRIASNRTCRSSRWASSLILTSNGLHRRSRR
jgi:predicted PurR-regulated permease PerM